MRISVADNGIYRKTEKGRAEIATRANKLGQRERTMLIMVDDKTTRSGLLSRSAHPGAGGMLDSLLAQGYIEIDPGAAPAGAVAVTDAAGPAVPAGGQAPVEVSLTSASRYACRALVTYLGPSADDLAALVEKAKSPGELRGTLEKCRDVIQAMAGRKKAEEFWAGATARLPPS